MKSMRTGRKNAYGFSLVELMVALLLGLVIMAGVSTVFVNSNKSYQTTGAMARLQENARFALQFIGNDIRRTGYVGCANEPGITYSMLNTGGIGGTPTPTATAVNGIPGVIPVEGVENINVGVGANIWTPSGNSIYAPTAPGMNITGVIDGTDAFFSRYLDMENGVPLAAPMGSDYDPVTITDADKTALHLAVDQIVTITDCTSTSIFQITGIKPSGSNDELEHAATAATATTLGNAAANLYKTYSYDDRPADTTRSTFGNSIYVTKFNGYAYFIGRGASGQRALFRTDPNSAGPQELVEGVEDMQITYGVTTIALPDGSDRVPNVYLKANQFATTAQWKSVISIRIGLLVSTIADTASGEYGTQDDVDKGTYDVNGTTVNAPKNTTGQNQRRMRKVFVTTYLLRNVKNQVPP